MSFCLLPRNLYIPKNYNHIHTINESNSLPLALMRVYTYKLCCSVYINEI